MVFLSLPTSPPSQQFGLGRISRLALGRPARKRTFYPDAKSRKGMKYSPFHYHPPERLLRVIPAPRWRYPVPLGTPFFSAFPLEVRYSFFAIPGVSGCAAS